MAPLSHIITTELKPVVGPDCDILVDASSGIFQEHAKRWSDIDRKTPAAIVLPTSEQEIQEIVSGKLGTRDGDADDSLTRYNGRLDRQYRSSQGVGATVNGPRLTAVVLLSI